MKRAGYVVIDHRNSPGLPVEIALRAGFDPKHCGAGGFYEADTQTCCHCKGVVLINKLRTRPRGHCVKCDGYICDACHALTTLPTYIHMPFEKFIDNTLARLGNSQELLLCPK